MRKVNFKATIPLIIVLLVIPSMMSNSSTRSFQPLNTPLNYKYVEHDPISITSDGDFVDFNGTGILDDPYIIEGLNISTNESYGIYVGFTSKHFIIQNCYIDASYAGICIESVASDSAGVANNFCVNSKSTNGMGIGILFSEKIVVYNNTCYGNMKFGIAAFFSPFTIIYENTCFENNYSGITVGASEYSDLIANNCSYNSMYGISIISSNITGCFLSICEGNLDSGIYLENSDQVFLSKNELIKNHFTGAFVADSTRFHFNYNLFLENIDFALFLDKGCESGEVSFNDFIDNGDSKYTQSYDSGKNNIWFDKYENAGNYWSEAEHDSPYFIDGDAESVDYFPLQEPVILPDGYNTENYTTVDRCFVLACSVLFSLVVFRRRNLILKS
ncbi:MAG: hypothetical protein GOP50_06140 [Candidatus Heimdallarchaeota archaeon]|nr:hypothetical protein [Candidatus Heimdallarchaeota archaeon]